MDTKLSDGDHALDRRGIPARIDGGDELIQRALIRLSVRRGSLVSLPAFGSELYKLRSARPEQLRQLARSYVQEALAPLGECAVSRVAVTREEDDITVTVALSRRGQTDLLEVNIP